MDARSADWSKMKDLKNMKPSVNLILLGIILLIAIISIIRIVIWNIGTKSDFDPNATTTDFDVEALDTIIPLDPDLLANKTDDGVNTILCLGNNPFSDDLGSTGIASLIGTETNSTVYNAAFPNSRIGAKYSSYSDDYKRDLFSLPYVAKSIADQDFKQLEAAAALEEDHKFKDAVGTLKEIDYSSLDTIIIMYDAIDYIEKTPADNPNDPYELSTYTGGLANAIESIQKAYPYVRILFLSHTFCNSLDENGNFVNGGSTDLGNGTLSHYLLLAVNVAINHNVTIIDNFYGSINENNYKEYLSDNIHLNEAGRKVIAGRVSEVLNTGSSSMR